VDAPVRGDLGEVDVERIGIVGCGGSGKSHLARQLGAALDLPVTHLDVVYFDQAWTPLPQAQFAAGAIPARQVVAGRSKNTTVSAAARRIGRVEA